MKSNNRKKPRLGASAAAQSLREKTQARLVADVNRRLMSKDQMEQLKVDSLNKLRTKGARNRNNPVNEIKKATEVVIVKQANYVNCVTCNICITDNVYKVYRSDVEHLLPKDFNEDWPSSSPNFSNASPAKKWQILPSKIEDQMNELEMFGTEDAPLNDYATNYNTNEQAKPGPSTGMPRSTFQDKKTAVDDDDDLLPPPNIIKAGQRNTQYEGGRRDTRGASHQNTAARNRFGGNRIAAAGESERTHSQQPANKAPFLRASNYFYAYGHEQSKEPTKDEILSMPTQALPAPEQTEHQMALSPQIPDATASDLQVTDGDEPQDEPNNVDLAGMAHEVDLEHMDLDGTGKPISSKEIDERLKELLKFKTKIKKSSQERNPRILKIEQESILLQKLMCPTSC